MKLSKRIMSIFIISILLIIGGVLLLIIYSNIMSVTEEKVTKSFNENYTVFSDIQQYISDVNGDFVVYEKEGEIKIYADSLYSNYDECPVKDQINQMFKKLKYVRIANSGVGGNEHSIVFYRTYGEVEWGVIYLKDNLGNYGSHMVKLRDEWYLFTMAYDKVFD